MARARGTVTSPKPRAHPLDHILAWSNRGTSRPRRKWMRSLCDAGLATELHEFWQERRKVTALAHCFVLIEG